SLMSILFSIEWSTNDKARNWTSWAAAGEFGLEWPESRHLEILSVVEMLRNQPRIRHFTR
ncbi:MAG TPA: hypothetical protein VF135_05485, partial [Terriglobales bacterium]